MGTSMPEVVTSIVASYRGEVDLAIGNSLGSNILNVAMVLGITAMIKPVQFSDAAVWADLGLACVVSLLLIPIVMSGSGRLGRFGGAMMVLAYTLYRVELLGKRLDANLRELREALTT